MKLLKILIISFCFFVSLNTANAEVDINAIPEEYQLNLYSAKIIEIKDTLVSGDIRTQIAEIKILNKDLKGQIFEVRNDLTGNEIYDVILKENRKISVHIEEKDNELNAYVVGYERSGSLFQILLIFVILLFLIGGFKGLKAIISLAITIFLILFLLVPLLLNGYNPIAVSVLTCTLASIITFLIISGYNKKTASAIIGTVGGLLIGGLIAYFYGTSAKLTGFSSSDAQMLLYLPNQIAIDFRGLLFAGIIIGALGACMDVSISIASALSEIQKENPTISIKKLMKSGFNIGKDIMGTMINTLILAYTGGSITTMLVFIGFEKQFNEIINLDSIATEILRALTGSIGLLFAIPITVFAYTLITKRRKNA